MTFEIGCDECSATLTVQHQPDGSHAIVLDRPVRRFKIEELTEYFDISLGEQVIVKATDERLKGYEKTQALIDIGAISGDTLDYYRRHCPWLDFPEVPA